MKKQTKQMLGIAGAAVLLVAGTAVASSYVTRNAQAPEAKPTIAQAQAPRPAQIAANQAPAQAPCDDNNIVGTVAGGAAGGLLGSRFGSGSGKTVATVGGVVGGAMLGNAYMPTRGVTCN